MIGAIIGDIAGSVYEWHNIKTKDFPMFKPNCYFTDDTVMTCAVAEAIMNGGKQSDFITAMKKYGRMYPNAGYGGRFRTWLSADMSKPYKSFGNGSAMRVSPCAWAINCHMTSNFEKSVEKVRQLAQLSAVVTHNHPEGIKGALATADAIFLCRAYFADREKLTETERDGIKLKIKEHVTKTYGYNLSFTLDEIRPTYKFDETCQGSVPQAIEAFLESTDFEDAIRNAISIGGDSDTIAAITGSIAEAAYGIPKEIKEQAYSFLDNRLKDILRRWKAYIKTPNVNI